MIKESIEYINKDEVKFDISIENAPVPKEANYWGFYFKVTERATGLSKIFKAMVKKEICQTEELAESFIKSDPLNYLKSIHLDNYKDGESPVVWPDITSGWLVI